MSELLETQYRLMTKAFALGRMVPFLGAGVNLVGRPPGASFSATKRNLLPSGYELARYLANEFAYPPEDVLDLARVSQYAVLMSGTGMVYDELHQIFDEDYALGVLPQLLADVPRLLRERGYRNSDETRSANLLIVTTNYDDVLERTFLGAGEPFDLLWYIADGDNRGRFWHKAPDGEPQLVDKPNEYGSELLKERPVILKIHGSVDRDVVERDSFVITEDHYIDFLARTDVSDLLPAKIAARLRTSHFLFLGYALRDWNLRVILQRLWGERKLSRRSWAIQLKPGEIDTRLWLNRGVEILDLDLAEFVEQMRTRLQALPVTE